MSEQIIYHEKVSSKRTEFLFVTLTLLFLSFLIWRVIAAGFDFLAGIFLIFFCFFLFYSKNYRVLVIRLTSDSLKLSFGIIRWVIPLNNISACKLDDDLPVLTKYGGAGIHFMVFRKRYRASFNFLEYSRVVIELKRKAGWVRDISFSTRHPNELTQRIQGVLSAHEPPNPGSS